MWINFRFWRLVVCHLRMAVMHLPTKFGANSAIQFGVIGIFRNSRWRPPQSWIFKSCQFGTFHHVSSVVLELYTKFGSNICYSHLDRRHFIPDIHLTTPRELTSDFDVWSRDRIRVVVTHLHTYFGTKIYIRSGVIGIFPKFKMADAAILVFQVM